MAIDYQDMLEIFLHRMLYPIVHNVAYDLYRQHQNKQPMDGFHKNTRKLSDSVLPTGSIGGRLKR